MKQAILLVVSLLILLQNNVYAHDKLNKESKYKDVLEKRSKHIKSGKIRKNKCMRTGHKKESS